MPSPKQHYAQQVLELYRKTPDTLGHIRKADRKLAAQLYDRGVRLQTIDDALILASARRAFRSHDAPPLNPIASLHYLLPLIRELNTAPPEPGYVDYLRRKLARKNPAVTRDHQIP